MSGVAMEDMRIFERAVTSLMTVCMAGGTTLLQALRPKIVTESDAVTRV